MLLDDPPPPELRAWVEDASDTEDEAPSLPRLPPNSPHILELVIPVVDQSPPTETPSPSTPPTQDPDVRPGLGTAGSDDGDDVHSVIAESDVEPEEETQVLEPPVQSSTAPCLALPESISAVSQVPVPVLASIPDYLEDPSRLAYPGPYAVPADRFPHASHDQRPRTGSYSDAHPLWFIRVFHALALVLHARHRVSVAALNLLLFTVRLVFVTLGVLDPTSSVNDFRSFATVLSRVDMKVDHFVKYPLCVRCHHLAPPESAPDYVCPKCDLALFWNRTRANRLLNRPLRARKRVGIASLSEQIASVLYDDTVQQALEKQESQQRRAGVYRNCYDGKVMQNLRGVDGRRFFGPGPREKNELRIAMTLSIDAFKPTNTTFADNHSTTAVSWSFASLDVAQRYEHMIVTSVIPGPNEPTAEQLQEHLVLPVNDLIDLYERGIRVYSPGHPEGRLVRVVLIAVICDHPALCRVCGFADKNHNNAPCTKCKITQKDIKTGASVCTSFVPRDGAEHKRRAWEWRSLPESKREAYFKEHGTRWFELARLSYFDPVRMTVIDPMHCLLLGVVKCLWYEVWIKGTKALRANTDAGRQRELQFIHTLLAEYEAPPWLGRLPKHIGEPAGGNLSSDEWRILAEAYGPVILPVLWSQTQDEADKEHSKTFDAHRKKLAKYEKDRKAFVDKAIASSNDRGAAEAAALTKFAAKRALPEPPGTRPRRTEDEMPMFLDLAAALRLLLGRSLTEDQRVRGQMLLLRHYDRFCAIYGDEYMKYNQHWSTHIAAQIVDFGPVYGFWTFPGERINKALKSLNTNNHRDGEMELTMLREFHRTQQTTRLLRRATLDATFPAEQEILARLIADGRRVRGTVDVARSSEAPAHAHGVESDDTEELARADEAWFNQIQLSPAPAARALTTREQIALSACLRRAGTPVYNSFDPRTFDDSWARLYGYASFHAFAILDGRRLVPVNSARLGNASAALVKLRAARGDSLGPLHGEVMDIFTHVQGNSTRTYATVRTFKQQVLVGTEWDFWLPYPELDVHIWRPGEYDDLRIVPIEQIVCQLTRTTYSKPNVWITIALEKNFADV